MLQEYSFDTDAMLKDLDEESMRVYMDHIFAFGFVGCCSGNRAD